MMASKNTIKKENGWITIKWNTIQSKTDSSNNLSETLIICEDKDKVWILKDFLKENLSESRDIKTRIWTASTWILWFTVWWASYIIMHKDFVINEWTKYAILCLLLIVLLWSINYLLNLYDSYINHLISIKKIEFRLWFFAQKEYWSADTSILPKAWWLYWDLDYKSMVEYLIDEIKKKSEKLKNIQDIKVTSFWIWKRILAHINKWKWISNRFKYAINRLNFSVLFRLKKWKKIKCKNLLIIEKFNKDYFSKNFTSNWKEYEISNNLWKDLLNINKIDYKANFDLLSQKWQQKLVKDLIIIDKILQSKDEIQKGLMENFKKEKLNNDADWDYIKYLIWYINTELSTHFIWNIMFLLIIWIIIAWVCVLFYDSLNYLP